VLVRHCRVSIAATEQHTLVHRVQVGIRLLIASRSSGPSGRCDVSLQKLSAGHGYDYPPGRIASMRLTAAAMTWPATTRGGVRHRGLGQPQLGRVDGLEAGDVVTADRMRLLFEGRHLLAGTSGPSASGPILALGAPYRPLK
jgi:hypothetical protein